MVLLSDNLAHLFVYLQKQKNLQYARNTKTATGYADYDNDSKIQ